MIILDKLFTFLFVAGFFFFLIWGMLLDVPAHPITLLIMGVWGAWIVAWWVGLGADDESPSTPYPDDDD